MQKDSMSNLCINLIALSGLRAVGEAMTELEINGQCLEHGKISVWSNGDGITTTAFLTFYSSLHLTHICTKYSQIWSRVFALTLSTAESFWVASDCKFDKAMRRINLLRIIIKIQVFPCLASLHLLPSGMFLFSLHRAGSYRCLKTNVSHHFRIWGRCSGSRPLVKGNPFLGALVSCFAEVWMWFSFSSV